ncbi:SAM-dependent methyltransferase [Terrimonas rubra]|uniref:SAM-dependent methyltransferase n=1 Tax=Terrimonas rubra TaxID=1035890 RepID=A0ABW6A4M3_9BACT
MANINDSYFDGHYKDIWREINPPELTRVEVEFMIKQFGLNKDSVVLDMMCGYGRHALALAREGVTVTAIDNLEAYTDEVAATAAAENLPVTTIRDNIFTYQPSQSYDLAICMGNSLNFFPEEDLLVILKTVADSLKPGGAMLIHSYSLAETVIKQFNPRTWTDIGELRILSKSRYLFFPTRMDTETMIITAKGEIEMKQAVDYIFSVSEMARILGSVGLHLKEIYTVPGRRKFAVGDPYAYMIAVKQ